MNRTAFALLLASACTSSSTEPPLVKSDLERNLTPAISDADLATLVSDNTAFAADLYREVRDEPGNLFMSPHSISTALAMTYAGASGTTATQMATALHFSLPPTTLHAGLSAIDLVLASRATAAKATTIPFRLRTANSLWGQDGKEFMSPFLDTLAVMRRLLPQAKASEPTLVVSQHPVQPALEHRVAARFPLGVETQVYLADGSVLPCLVKDASREGVRLVVRLPLSRDTVGNLHVFFNGIWLRKDVQVVRSEGTPGQFEIGARFAPWQPQEDEVAEGFEKYLRWKSQAA